MDFVIVFGLLLKAFEKEGIEFALIGGFALQAVGLTRTTGDIDFLILAQDAEKVKAIMTKQGYKIIYESEDVLNFLSDELDFGRVDFLLAHREYALAMLKRAQTKEILQGKFKIKTLQVEDIIGLKIQSSSNDSSRFYQDMADVKMLVKDNYPQLDIKLLKEYFSLFNREKELDNIIEEFRDVK